MDRVAQGLCCTILYHPDKAKVVADAFSRKPMGSLAYIAPMKRPLVKEIHQLEADGIRLELGKTGILLAYIRAQSSLVERIKVMQGRDPKLSKLIEEVKSGKHYQFATLYLVVWHVSNGLLACTNRLRFLNESGKELS